MTPVAIALACALVGCQAAPVATPIRLSVAQSGSLTVRIAPDGGYKTQHLAVQDWEEAEGTLENATLGVAPVTVTASAVLDAATQTRSAALNFTGLKPGAGYTLTLRLKRRDPAGTLLVVAEAAKPAIDLVAGANAVTWDQSLVPHLETQAPVPQAFTSYVSSLFGGTIAEFDTPQGLAFDASGHLYLAEANNHRIRRVDLAGAGVTTVAGGSRGFANGVGASTEFAVPVGVAIDAQGVVFVADRDNNRIRKLTFNAEGVATVTTVAGNSNAGFVDGVGGAAQFDAPVALAFDGDGYLWVAERDNNAIRKLTFDGAGVATVSTIAGTGAFGFAVGTASDAQFRNPGGIVYDPVHDHIIIADTGNNRIRVLHQHNPVPEIETIAGLDVSGFADGDLSTAKFSGPTGLAWGPDDCLYVADKDNRRIRRLTFASDVDVTVDTVAGTGASGSTNGAGATATFQQPVNLTFNPAGELFVSDGSSDLVHKLVFGGAGATVSTAAGSRTGSADGPLASVLGNLQDLAVEGTDTLYVAEGGAHRIGRVTVDASGQETYTVIAGSTSSGFANGDGATARFSTPSAIVTGAPGELFIADTGNNRIRKLTIDSLGVVNVTTIAGSGAATFADGDATTARFKAPQGLCRAADGTLFVADSTNNRIRKVVIDGSGGVTVTTVAGTGAPGGADGPGASATFSAPEAIAVAADGTLYVADTANHKIRRITFDALGAATVDTIAGTGSSGSTEGLGSVARFAAPSGIEVESSGSVLVGDEDNNKIRRITFTDAGAVVTTVAGTGTIGFSDGPGTMAQFSSPEGVAVGPDGRIYVADKGRGLIRVVR
jgi:sugar lactone lactonase YvrE